VSNGAVWPAQTPFLDLNQKGLTALLKLSQATDASP
jgi:hypothetical protein